jgi:hypothetical protein
MERQAQGRFIHLRILHSLGRTHRTGRSAQTASLGIRHEELKTEGKMYLPKK